ncbi:DUF4355 domain-containing protein [Streptococcus thoraltensis]|uniref:DUF4355 domain-containing protein n=1 Tax=Streptococcus thoraltensis TaxID=55085 RepID=UPI001F59FF4D|nr:DUF4355 domain-containing protein [Streptococcus thoraltensis]
MADVVENGVVEDTTQEQVDTQEEVKSDVAAEKTYTQAEVTEMIKQNVNRAVAKAHKEAEEKAEADKNEAKKLANMDEKQKADYKQQKLLDELQSLRDEKTRFEMTNVARGMLSESNITLPDELLEQLVTLDAEQTKANIESFTEAFQAAVSAEVKKTIRQDTPHLGGGISKQTNFGASLAKDSKPSGTLV